MKAKITIVAIIILHKPLLMASAPKVGPTTASSTILVGAGNLPLFKIFAKSPAYSLV
jgi:hypothetical protein